MTGIGGLVFGPPPAVGTKWGRFWRILRRFFRRQGRVWLPGRLLPNGGASARRFVVLCFRRTGSNWLCGMLFNHEEILMHNELFNENGVHTYYKSDVLANNWDYEGRDVNPSGFLDFMFSPHKFAKFRVTSNNMDGLRSCKAVGYKSFPNHYLQKGVPLQPLFNCFQEKVLGDLDVCKIILIRRDVLRTYISSRRAFETGHYITRTYHSHKVQVDLVDLQRFVDRYVECYREYRLKTRGHPRVLVVSYEDLCQDPVQTMKPAWKLLGVQEITEPKSLRECVPQSAGALAPLRESIVNYDEVEYACRHDPDLNQFLDLNLDTKNDNMHRATNSVTSPQTEATNPRDGKAPYCRWALLIPIRASSDDTVEDCRRRVQTMYDSIQNTTTSEENLPLLVFGVDDDDPIYTDGSLLREVCGGDRQEIAIQVLSGLQGRICRIWKWLAAAAFDDHDIDFTILLGDDVVILNNGWQSSIEQRFASIARNQELPYGAACVAFCDESFPGFPTFPVIHKWHYQTFEGSLLPSQFDNQGGDPYLFELYKRLGSSQFALDCKLQNTIGGKHQARYTKQRLRFEDDILTASIKWIQKVVPEILALRASWPVQVSFWVVLDNPEHKDGDRVRALQSVQQNYQVNVLEQFDAKGRPRNYGASAARNYGLAHSKADFCVLIDDDCIPSEQLLDAYVGAILRSPNASVFVGLTNFPEPHNLLTHAVVASDIPGAYSIAKRTREPPWGVTANLCVKARQSRVRFDLSFPKTGGGEDLDYCARARLHGVIKSAPGAAAHHPWWRNGDIGAVWHILSWAEGEVLCVGKQHMREHVFWTCPNGVETIFALTLSSMLLRYCLGVTQVEPISARFAVSLCVLALCEVAWQASRIGAHRLRHPVAGSFWRALLVRCVAALLILSQESVRFLHALDHSPFWVLWRVDWHFGQMPHLVIARKRNNLLRFLLYTSLMIFFNFSWPAIG
ncbi:3-beta hydroxysteroid dehydrogenase/isomerase family [Seminavis robusta]|uniref:3-beta hydroxysteroid dehydrogenase/isomerase family n=1 Tax=Seminavis robusta TaxID=568900 RepID=A0A9N8EBZ7_9STRA|nr:3-beta hydroxysteroid dehydrogenase/isomerase family [Seminavis robusta]|eukprot:Sro948_g223500.1 3-beta hydroxysteroid dehydrogenase/isomerase family (962) ;mRNA; r:8200-11154